MMRYSIILVLIGLFVMPSHAAEESSDAREYTSSSWYGFDKHGEPVIDFYFFWSEKCPHCQRALPVVERLEVTLPWLNVHSLEVTRHRENAALYRQMASGLGRSARSVPGFLFCKTMLVGFEGSGSTEKWLVDQLEQCRSHLRQYGSLKTYQAPDLASAASTALRLPLLGRVDATTFSLPVLTMFIAAMDAFNPCAFFVLLFLLSFLVHAQSRWRMVLVGGTFVFFSGLLYFLFMAAWLNLFMLVGHLNAITLAAGALAVIVGVINVKDFFWFKEGVSLSIPDQAKPGLYRRMRTLLERRSLGPLLLGASGLALFANLYEFLCTAGFPMVYTRILTLRDLPGAGYYLYLVLYQLIYVLPLAVIVVLFTVTLGRRKLSEGEGRALKLLSGVMMTGLGLVLVAEPAALNNPRTAVLLLVGAVGVTLAIVLGQRLLGRHVP